MWTTHFSLLTDSTSLADELRPKLNPTPVATTSDAEPSHEPDTVNLVVVDSSALRPHRWRVPRFQQVLDTYPRDTWAAQVRRFLAAPGVTAHGDDDQAVLAHLKKSFGNAAEGTQRTSSGPCLLAWATTQDIIAATMLRWIVGGSGVAEPQCIVVLVPEYDDIATWTQQLRCVAPAPGSKCTFKVHIVKIHAYVNDPASWSALEPDIVIVAGLEHLTHQCTHQYRRGELAVIASHLRATKRWLIMITARMFWRGVADVGPLTTLLSATDVATTPSRANNAMAVRERQMAWDKLCMLLRRRLIVHLPRVLWAMRAQVRHASSDLRHRIVRIPLSVARTWTVCLVQAHHHRHAELSIPSWWDPSVTIPVNCSIAHSRPRKSQPSSSSMSSHSSSGSSSSGSDLDLALTEICNSADPFLRTTAKWSWLVKQLTAPASARLLPMVICSQSVPFGIQLLRKLFYSTREVSHLRVAFMAHNDVDATGPGLIALATAMNTGAVDVVCVVTDPRFRAMVTMHHVASLVMWEPCASARTQQELLTLAKPRELITLVASFPESQLSAATQSSLARTDEFLHRECRRRVQEWPHLHTTPPPTSWPRVCLLDALAKLQGSERPLTIDEQHLRTCQDRVIRDVPQQLLVCQLSTNGASPPTTTPTPARLHAVLPAAPVGAGVGRGMGGGQGMEIAHVDPKVKVTQIKKQCATRWRAWKPQPMSMNVWSRKITPMVTQIIRESPWRDMGAKEIANHEDFIAHVRMLVSEVPGVVMSSLDPRLTGP